MNQRTRRARAIVRNRRRGYGSGLTGFDLYYAENRARLQTLASILGMKMR